MRNQDTDAAKNYHRETKHSYQNVQSSPHFLDWENKPRLFKVYRNLEPISLDKEAQKTGVPALRAIYRQESESRALTIPDLATILHYSAGFTRSQRYPGGEVQFRAASCTGALYSIELYVVSGELQGLPAGIYLFSPSNFSLVRIRSGDFRGSLVHATAGEGAIAHAPATIVSTGTYWRNAWKYRARTYRHFGWDNGTILAHLLAVASAMRLSAQIVTGFVDRRVNQLLGLDTEREVALSMVPLGAGEIPVELDPAEIPPLELPSLPYSPREVRYPIMNQIHADSSLETPDQVRDWRDRKAAKRSATPSNKLIPLTPATDDEIPQEALEDVILRRGSTRRFRQEPITFQQLSTILVRTSQGVAADFITSPDRPINDLYLICNAVEDLAPGAYFHDRDSDALELLKEGDFRRQAGYLGLEQALPADCSAAIFFLADLDAVLKQLGNRGYRAAQLEAGVMGGRIYLAAYAQRLGATGLTFFDDDVTAFFSPHAAGKSAIFLVAVGKSAKPIR